MFPKSFQQLLEQQKTEENRAIYDVSLYSLANIYKSYWVDSARWHSWDEETRENHIKNMRSYSPKPSDSFNKPSDSRKNPGSTIRTRKEQPTELNIHKKLLTVTKISVFISVNHLQQMSPDCHFPKLRTKEMSDSLTPVTKDLPKLT